MSIFKYILCSIILNKVVIIAMPIAGLVFYICIIIQRHVLFSGDLDDS